MTLALRITAIAGVVATTTPTAAQPPSPVRALRVHEVLRSARTTHPAIARARAQVSESKGRRLAARGAFDPVLATSGAAMTNGYYRYRILSSSVEQNTGIGGIRLRAGYRLGAGEVPPYYGDRATHDLGELFAGFEVPLLADRRIDAARAGVRKAELGLRAQRLALESTWNATARDATFAYWDWVGAGRKVHVAERLLDIAKQRTARINARAAQGVLPRITVVDSERIVLARQSSLLAAQRGFARAQASLSLYYRDARGQPIFVDLARVPATDTKVALGAPAVQAWIDEAIANRPDLRMTDMRARQLQVDLSLARNNALPRLSLGLSTARGLGAGAATLGRTELGIGLTLSMPMWRRSARGQQREAEAKLAYVDATQRGLRDRITAEVRVAIRTIELATKRVELALSRLRATERLADAERLRLQQGASDMVTVNLRELDVAAAAQDAIDAQIELQRGLAELAYARGRSGPDR